MRNICLQCCIVLFLLAVGRAEGRTLGEKLWDIESLQNGKNTPFAEVEAMAGLLLKEYPAPEDQGRIYYQLALVYAQSGPVCEETIRNAKAALDLPLGGAKRLQLYVYWGDAIQVRHAGARGNDLMAARKEAAEIYLRGLKECVDHKVPKDKPAVEASGFGNFDGPETDEIRRLKAEIAARNAANEDALSKIAMVEMQDTLIKQLVYMYSRFPFATNELEASAKDSLGDSWLVGELINKTQAEIKKRVKDSEKKIAERDKTIATFTGAEPTATPPTATIEAQARTPHSVESPASQNP